MKKRQDKGIRLNEEARMTSTTRTKTVLVTGGAGFIGTHLCKALLDRSHHVICLDNLFTGNKRNVQPYIGNPSFEFIRHDITQPINLEIDQIYNLACPASPPAYQYNAIKTVKTNTIGMINMLGLAKRVGARILQASTSEVYGCPNVHPQPEAYWGNVNPIGIRSCYDEGKRIAECLCMDYHRMHKVDIRIVRIFNTYGPNMDPEDGRVVSNFVMQALKNEPITIYGKGDQTRSFQYVSDLIKGMIAMMEQDAFIGPVNIGNPGEFTMLQLAQKVIELTGSRSQIVYKPLPKDDPQRRCPDITFAKEKLNWKPTIQLEEGLAKTIDYFRQFARQSR